MCLSGVSLYPAGVLLYQPPFPELGHLAALRKISLSTLA